MTYTLDSLERLWAKPSLSGALDWQRQRQRVSDGCRNSHSVLREFYAVLCESHSALHEVQAQGRDTAGGYEHVCAHPSGTAL
jgi:hypothetical protein